MLGASDKVKRPSWPSWIVTPIGLTIREHVEPPANDQLRVVVATRGNKGLDDEVDILDLARAHFFTIVDIHEKKPERLQIVRNTLSNVPRAGLAVVYWLVRIGTNIAIASGFCKNTEYYLEQTGIIYFKVDPGKKVRDCLIELKLIRD